MADPGAHRLYRQAFASVRTLERMSRCLIAPGAKDFPGALEAIVERLGPVTDDLARTAPCRQFDEVAAAVRAWGRPGLGAEEWALDVVRVRTLLEANAQGLSYQPWWAAWRRLVHR